MLGTECLDGRPFRTCGELERDKLPKGAVSWPLASPPEYAQFRATSRRGCGWKHDLPGKADSRGGQFRRFEFAYYCVGCCLGGGICVQPERVLLT